MKKGKINTAVGLGDEYGAICNDISGDNEGEYEMLTAAHGELVIVITQLGHFNPTNRGNQVFCFIPSIGYGTWMLEEFVDYEN